MNQYTVRDQTGSVDVAASVAAYSAALDKWVASNELDVGTIDVAVNTVFDRFPDTKLSMAQLVSSAVAEINPDPTQYSALFTRVQNFVRGQTKAGVFVVSRGIGGGVTRAV